MQRKGLFVQNAQQKADEIFFFFLRRKAEIEAIFLLDDVLSTAKKRQVRMRWITFLAFEGRGKDLGFPDRALVFRALPNRPVDKARGKGAKGPGMAIGKLALGDHRDDVIGKGKDPHRIDDLAPTLMG